MVFTSCKNHKGEISRSVNEFASLELGTVEYTVTKVVAADKGLYYNDIDLSLGDKKILYSVTGTLKAGVDLSNFDASKGIITNGKSATLNLPKPILLSLNISPSSIRYEFSKVSWFRKDFSEKERNEILRLGEQSIRDAVKNIGILKDAEKNARDYFESVLGLMGYETITINFI